MSLVVRWSTPGLILLAGLATPALAQPADKDHAEKMARGLEVFKEHVRPLLVARCLNCHGGKKTEAEFDLSDRDRLLRGGSAGPAILAGNAKDSLLVKLVAHAREPHMPHKASKLPEESIQHLARWIDLGAPYDKPLIDRAATADWKKKVVPVEARQFWAFQPLHHVKLPAVKDEVWCRTPIDRFILARQEAAGLSPNPPVDRRQLIRRAYFDLIGLPPSPAEVEAFLRDEQPEAYERLLDRLLDNPHFGERWARHWLDLARFGESHGFEQDYDRPSAYTYRDFVIRAFNDNLPYDTFVRWQIAGDEFAPDNPLAVRATGFLAAGVHATQITKREVEKHRYDELDDKLATIGTAMLGLTIGCARCHDHKFDPIPQADYYRLLSTFTTTVRSDIPLPLEPRRFQDAKAAFDREHEPLVAKLREAVPLPVVTALIGMGTLRAPQQALSLEVWRRGVDPTWRDLKKRVDAHAAKEPKPEKALIASEGLPAIRLHTQGADFFNETYFLRRGDCDQKEGVANQGFLQVLMPAAESAQHWRVEPPPGWRTSYRRRALANWLTDVDAGAGRLLARVIVNRLWQHHFGRGLVATPSDFGTRGAPPSHPELLDWLATELIRNGWHLKPLHKLMMSSATYMQGSRIDPAKAALDRDNQLVWRRPPHRLEAEVLRDALLSVGGRLDATLYGPSTLDESSRRRSIYFMVKRSKLIPMMHVFDAPDSLQGIGERPATTVPSQALMLMNNANIRECAKGLARRAAPDSDAELRLAIRSAYEHALARPPQEDEVTEAETFIRRQMESYAAAQPDEARRLALADFCQVLLCLNEFAYVD